VIVTGRGDVGLALVHDYLAVILQLLERSANVIGGNCQFLRGGIEAQFAVVTLDVVQDPLFQRQLSLFFDSARCDCYWNSGFWGLWLGNGGSSGNRSFIC